MSGACQAARPARNNPFGWCAIGRSSLRETKKKTPRLRDVEGPSLETRVGSLLLRRLAQIRCYPLSTSRKPANLELILHHSGPSPYRHFAEFAVGQPLTVA